MKTTTTTNRALTQAELTAERRATTTAVFTDYIKSNRNKDYYFNSLYQELLYQDAEKAVYIALRARHSKSGLTFLAELQNAQATDRTARNNTAIAEQLTTLEAIHESHRKGFEFFNSRANRLTLTDYERALAFTLAEDFKHKAEKEQQQINTLADALNLTLSDRADLTQTALVKMLELEQTPAEISQTVLASYGATTKEELTEKELQQAQTTANFRAIINAVGQAINKLATPDALNRTTTKAEPITAEQVADYILQYGTEVLNGLKIPHTTKRASASQCYITIEERNTATQKGYYKVIHYKTIAPYQYIEDFNTADDTENDIAYLKTYNPIIDKFADLENIENLLNLANLNERERQVIKYYCNALRFYDTKADIIKYICTNTKLSTATIYRLLESSKKALEPTAKKLHIIK